MCYVPDTDNKSVCTLNFPYLYPNPVHHVLIKIQPQIHHKTAQDYLDFICCVFLALCIAYTSGYCANIQSCTKYTVYGIMNICILIKCADAKT